MDIQKEWFSIGEKYGTSINEMLAFVDKHGWDNWKDGEMEDTRQNLADTVFQRLKEANQENKTEEFRQSYPPSHAPFGDMLEKKGQCLEMFCFIEHQRIVFFRGTSYQKRQAYLLDGDQVIELDSEIYAIGKSMQNNVFAIATAGKICTYQNWEGHLIREFHLKETATIGITQLIPFNDGQKVLLVSSSGIYLLTAEDEKLIHPIKEEDDDDEDFSEIDMENATLSNNNQYIVAGDQCRDHQIMDANGNPIAVVCCHSSYPHYCLFSKDDSQLITNSCHFYNGVTIGVNTNEMDQIEKETSSDEGNFVFIDETMRVYAGVATSDYYILGDAYGYIKAFDKEGKTLWRHFLGSTIGGMAISDDEKTLWVGSCSGMLHKLQLGKGHRDTHTIGNGEHYEEFRLIIWKDEPQIWKW